MNQVRISTYQQTATDQYKQDSITLVTICCRPLGEGLASPTLVSIIYISYISYCKLFTICIILSSALLYQNYPVLRVWNTGQGYLASAYLCKYFIFSLIWLTIFLLAILKRSLDRAIF